eukprot:29013-Pelagococcus_subviridis.AAC.1
MDGEKRSPGEKVLKERRSPRERGRMGTGARHREDAADASADGPPARARDPIHLLPSRDRAPQRSMIRGQLQRLALRVEGPYEATSGWS